MNYSDIFTFDGVIECKSNKSTRVWYLQNAEKKDFEACICTLKAEKCICKEQGGFGNGILYAAFENGNDGIFINYFPASSELRAVVERNCRYFNYTDKKATAVTEEQLTQVHLEDFGASHIVRLSDGRFIVFDGGREFEQDAQRLFRCLKETSPYEKPTIAMWIMTHAHEDHYLCFLTFFEKYANDVVIEKFLLNFPEHDDTENFPGVMSDDPRVERNVSAYVNIPILWDYIGRSGADVYMPHTGQSYTVGSARLEILSTLDDIMHNPGNNINASSTVIRMEIAGQTVLWCADSALSIAKIPQRYGEYLKADILQVPHHGFGCGRPNAEIEGYKYIRPTVCVLPVADYHAYVQFCSYKEDTRFLMTDLGVEEFITGDETSTIPLPYTVPDFRKFKHLEKLNNGTKANGCKSWVFTELDTGIDKDTEFTFLNMTNTKATVTAELFFEDTARNLKYITIILNPNSYRKINIVGSEVDDSAKWFNSMSIAKRGVPENAFFAVRFMSDCEIVISHGRKKETYKSL